MSKNTKERHLEIYNAAKEVLDNAGGVSCIDSLPQKDRIPVLREMAKKIKDKTACHIDSAKRNLAKAMRRERYRLIKTREIKKTWGGPRKGSGRPKKSSQLMTEELTKRLNRG
jgi:hypothetical protein